MWLFLATEVMFFTGLIGSYIVLRAGSPHNYYSNLYSPATSLKGLENTEGVLIKSLGSSEAQRGARPPRRRRPEPRRDQGASSSKSSTRATRSFSKLTHEKAETLKAQLHPAGAEVEIEPLKTHKWPVPYDDLTNPLAINLTAFNTFVLICSSVTMVLALSGFQRGNQLKGRFFLLGATVLIGSCFLSIQVYEYCQLMVGHHYPPGISATTISDRASACSPPASSR